MKEKRYAPLFQASNVNIDNIPEKSGWKKIFQRALGDIENVIPFVWADDDFLKAEYTGELKYLNDAFLQRRGELYGVMTGSSEIPKSRSQDIAYSREVASMFLVDNFWSRDKEVYRFDAEMELALADSEEVKFPVRVLDRLPYQCIYIEFAEDGIFRSNFHGAFVYACPCNNGYILVMQRIKEDGRCMFGHVTLIPPVHDGVFLFRREDITSENGIDRNRDWKEFGFFVLNALLYLCADNAEIRQNEENKKTYRPSGTVKNRFREVRKWECEFRIARKKAQPVKKNLPEEGGDEEDGKTEQSEDDKQGRNAGKVSYAITPHTRRAHWHHYWTGKGRKVLVLKWIAPTRVGYGDGIAVVHEVKEEKKGLEEL